MHAKSSVGSSQFAFTKLRQSGGRTGVTVGRRSGGARCAGLAAATTFANGVLRLIGGLAVIGIATATVHAETPGTALVRHAPTLNGSVEGSIQQLTAENTTLNGGASVTGDLLVPGTPTVRLNGKPIYGGTLDGVGAAPPSNYTITLNGGAALGHVVRRTPAVALPVVSAPPQPSGTRSVSLNKAGQSPGDFATLRHLTLNGKVGQVAVPPGTYGNFIANGGSGFVLGVAGATQPAAYNFQNLTLNSNSSFEVVGPAVVTVSGGFSTNGNMGSTARPEWLKLRISGGGLSLNGSVLVCAWVEAPEGTITLNGNSRLVGAVASDRLIVNGNSLLRLVTPTVNNQPPVVALTGPANDTVVEPPASISLSASVTDTDGSIAKVEFFNGANKLGEAASAPYGWVWSDVGSGSYTLTAVATDDLGASTMSAPVAIVVNARPVADPKSVTTIAATPVQVVLTASDKEGDVLVYSIESGPSHGVLSGAAPSLTYTPHAGYAGSDSFTYVVSDLYSDSAPATVTVQVQPASPPIAQSTSIEVRTNASVAFELRGSNPTGGPLTFAVASAPALGSVQMVSAAGQVSQWTYTAAGSPGIDAFTFTVSNGLQTSAPATVKVRVVPAPPTGDGPSGQAGGMVRDAATLEPIEGVVIHVRDIPGAVLSGEDGHFMIPVVQFGEETAKMIVLEYAAPGYITTYRRVIAYVGAPVTADPVFLKQYDAKVTVIGTVGGTATNAAGDVEADFPVGAAGSDLRVQLTNYVYGRELPGHLPKASAFTYAVDLAPNGASFSVPVTVRIANVLGFAPHTPVPVGLFNPETVRWEHESMGTISSDGRWVVFQVTHFSTRDGNCPEKRGPTDSSTNSESQNNDSKKVETDPGVSVAKGTYEADIDLPSYRTLGVERSVKLRYESHAASGRRPFTVNASNGSATASPRARSFKVDIAGRNFQTTFAGEPASECGSYFGGAVLDLHDMPSGLYPYRLSVSNLYPTTYGTSAVFGGSIVLDTLVPTREAAAHTASTVSWLPWVNASASPCGAGWMVDGVSRLYFSPGSDQVMLASGGAEWRIFNRKLGLRGSANVVGPFVKDSLFSVRKDYAGGLLIAHGDGITRMAPDQTLSIVASGVSGSRVANGGSSGPINGPGGIIDMAEAESGSIYFITRIDIPNAASPIQSSGLFRLDPGSTAFHAMATDLVAPTEVQVDRQARIYVFDAADGSIWRFNAAGIGERLIDDLNSFGGMAFDENLGRLYFTVGGAIRFIAGDDTVTILASANDLPDVYEFGRPVIAPNGDVQAWARDYSAEGQGTVFRFSAGGALVGRQVTSMDDSRALWETTRLGKFWWIGDLPFLGYIGSGSATAAGQTVAVATATSTSEVHIFELREFDGSSEVYTHEGTQTEELTRTDDGWELDDRHGLMSYFASTGLLRETKDRNGNTTAHVYDAQDRLLKIVDPVGAVTTFSYNAAGKLSRIDDPAGRSTSFTIDGAGNLVAVALPDGGTHRYSYDAEHRIVEKTDGLGHKLSFVVAGNGVYSKITYADNTTTLFQPQRTKALAVSDPIPGVNRGYDTDLPERVSAETPDGLIDSNGNESKFVLDERGYRISRTDALGYTTSVRRDSRDRVVETKDARGYTSEFSYDQAGNQIMASLPEGAATYTGYHPVLNLPTEVIDARGNATTFEYDNLGNLLTRTNALGNATTFTYNNRGQVLTQTNALGETTRWSYDLKGNVQSVTDPAGAVTTLTTDAAGRVLAATDPLGRTTTFTYDQANRVLSTTTADGATTRFTYDTNGNRTSTTDPLGAVTRYTYDAMNQLVRITAPDSSETRYAYDDMGNRTRVVDPLGHATLLRYDAENRLTAVTDPLGRSTNFTLDGNGNQHVITDALGRATTTEFDGLNRPVSRVAPDGGITGFEYNPAGNLVLLIDPLEQETTWEYDALNRVVKKTDALGGAQVMVYDDAGRVKTTTNRRGQALQYTYDAAGRPVALDLAGVDRIAWTYDAVGNPLEVTDSDSVVRTTYDAVNRPVSVKQTHGTLGYAYDLAGRRTQLSAEAGVVGYTYDANNRLIGLTDPASRSYTFAWDAAGRMTRLEYPNGTSAALTYDAAGQLTEKLHLRGTTLLGENTYVHNRVGDIEGWGTSDGNIRTFAYDPNDRLLSANSSLPSVGNETFAYDRMGNWTPFDGRVHNAANELIEDAGHTYRYDADGNMVEKRSKVDASQVTTYGWDPLNRLIEVTTPTHTVRYRYDGVGRRIAKSVNGIETRYILDEQNVLEEKDASNVLTASNLHAGLDVLLMQQDYTAGATYWAHTDHLGSVETLTDAAGSVVERYGYSSFGQVTVMDASFGVLSSRPKTFFTYTARDWEPETGLLFHRARFMDPQCGRWLSRDPIEERGGVNLYVYGDNNPNNSTDPSGLDAVFTYTNGKESIVRTAAEFKKAANAANPGEIQSIYTTWSHATSESQTIGSGYVGTTDVLKYDLITGDVLLIALQDYSVMESIRALLESKMAPGSWISLDGCKTAQGDSNIAKALSELLKGVAVTGNQVIATQNLLSGKYTYGGMPRTYVNGTVVGLDPRSTSKESKWAVVKAMLGL